MKGWSKIAVNLNRNGGRMKKNWIFGLVLVLAVFLFSAGDVLAKTWYVPKNFTTIQAALDSASVLDGDTILVGPGNFAGAIVRKAVEIKARSLATINDGPLPWGTARPFKAGFFFEGLGAGSGAKISNLRFQKIEFPVFSRGANDVAVQCCTMLNAIQAVTNWHGQGWQIIGNCINDLQTSNGGGIGVLCGGVNQNWQSIIKDNIIKDNKILGTLHVMPGDGGGYNGSGIVLYSDSRWGALGAKAITCNMLIDNCIAIKSDTSLVVDIAAIELTDASDNPGLDIIYGNSVVFNDLKKTALKIDLTPDDLDQVNLIYSNTGYIPPVTMMTIMSTMAAPSVPVTASPFFE